MSEYQVPLAFVAGATAYLFYFHRGEHHLMGVAYIQAFFPLSATAVIILNKAYGQELALAIKTVALIGTSFLVGIYSTLLVWRAFFHPLNKFPGPFGARISSFWWTFRVGTSSHAFLKVQELHAQYGSYLRIGSNDMAIADPNAVNLIYGPNSKCRKAISYDIDKPMVSLHTDRNREAHDRRRRIWSPAFSDKALRDYEKRMEPYADVLRDRIEETKGQPVDISKWFNFFGYDVMGNLAFGKDFNMLHSGKEHFAISLLNDGMQPVALHREHMCSCFVNRADPYP
jgi:tryprostatin B 6-hydroxylase